ncbi:helix-turn-helix domain-containing protein [Microbacterium oxydans]|uniref:helix-turn-helix domain-containing protein n=1 Tax=Microbacterium oxydans TaxID=82380 RepID=UPI0037CB2F4A
MKRDMTLLLQAERDKDFLRCERSGMSAAKIAERFGVDPRTVVRWRTRLGVNHAPPSTPHPMSDRALVEHLLDEGCSFQEAARTVGIDRSTVYRWFPDRRPWSKSEAGQFSAMVRHYGRAA